MENYKNIQPLSEFDWEAFEKGTVEGGESQQEQEASYDKTLGNVTENDVVEGTVISINKREVVVSIGFKSDGIVPVSEFRYNPELQVGDKVEVYIENQEDKKGQLVLSHKKARLSKAWDRINQALQDKETIKGFIKCRTKGGMIVDVFGIEAFLPGSQIDVKPIRDYDIFVGKTMEFQVVKINQEYKNVVVSHKALIEAELEAQKQEIISKLQKGQVLEGTVKNITSYGVFIDLRRRRLDPHHRPFLGSRKRSARSRSARPEAQRRYPRLRRREEAHRAWLEAAHAASLGRFST